MKRRQNMNAESRKKACYAYSLPGVNSELLPVCRQMFLGTVGISERQVRTTMAKIQQHGHIENEKRGGRPPKMLQRDRALRDDVERHIDRFPRMESHYCRKKTSYQYLSPDLNLIKMYELYQRECCKENRITASLSLYKDVFYTKKLKFHVPKKDVCGLCDTFNRGNQDERDKIKGTYEKHIAEKQEVRKVKEVLKSKANTDPSFLLASFDLQQVLYVPKSARGELFYKRKLACYNFTICEIGKMDGFCYFWHEGIARRGANEIASNVYHFLCEVDTRNVSDIAFFADGCCGQNKNSILPTMLGYFLKSSKKVEKITVYFFETNHGQNEGDCMHSVIERSVKRTSEIMLPSQLATVIRMASKRPYRVTEVQTSDITDWKQLAKDRGVLRVRTSEEGDAIDWTNFMVIQLNKELPNKIFFKNSHLQMSFSSINLEANRRRSNPEENLSMIETPKISNVKFEDLMTFCNGNTPVIYHPEHKAFYQMLLIRRTEIMCLSVLIKNFIIIKFDYFL
ncbi:hypothetical protein BSL78_04746 [Apostichopus japonicus]|uniref:DUF7869 domain-containing protein n=1 Tax=Stichopus japonicus TaxID=307972 RepID=A0A2G8LDL7_STIJA|nr:hypothetical protein BSL78_04746 [Apostichopus japonicus]